MTRTASRRTARALTALLSGRVARALSGRVARALFGHVARVLTAPLTGRRTRAPRPLPAAHVNALKEHGHG
ncbi:hypothetical protein ACH4E5_39880 [Streptomyces afghaniensis]|uniref:hypothetical protein n=1 Tax=Streptomyces afghaniensis TaxID=66865 RepID=UPI0037A2F877